MTALGEVIDQIGRDLTHFFREQGRTVNLGNAQCAVHGVKVLLALAQQRDVVLLLAERLERRARVVQLARELAGDDVQSLG